METLPTLRTWSWYAGALHQYQTAFLLLAELFTYPNRREADRIWKVLDYVFEIPPELSRDEKARIILTEIRDKMNAYRTARKLKAPTSMNRRIVDASPRSELGLAQRDPFSLSLVPPEMSTDAEIPLTVGNAQISMPLSNGTTSTGGELYFPAPGGELRAAVVPAFNAEESTQSDKGSVSGGNLSSGGGSSTLDDMMADIDWVKQFPFHLDVNELISGIE